MLTCGLDALMNDRLPSAFARELLFHDIWCVICPTRALFSGVRRHAWNQLGNNRLSNRLVPAFKNMMVDANIILRYLIQVHDGGVSILNMVSRAAYR